MFYSQAGQDEWVLKKTQNKKNGYFIDIGAYNGIEYSNSFYLEKNLGWEGICIEPDKNNYEKLIKARNCICKNLAVTNFKGEVPFINSEMGSKIVNESDINIDCDRLDNILISNNAPAFIDYLSIDVEGKEIDIISDFPFDRWRFGLITIEHNLYCDGDYRKKEIMKILTKNGYKLEVENVCHNGLPFEDWYSIL
jgi:FkbM family methyltransferase